jgi:catechol 2,3-dioxygenase-like lactoylglutathione lyase family enzyme
MKHHRLAAVLLATVPTAVVAQTETPPILSSARFEQVALTTADLPAARSFYRDRLGLRLMFEANNMLFFDVSGTRLMIAKDSTRQKPTKPVAILYFHVDDFVAARKRLEGAEATLVGTVETVQSTPNGMLQLQQFEDPDGNMLAIMGYVAR